MTVHPERGIVVWQPTREQVGTHQVVLRVQDGRGGIDLQSFTITVAPPNTAPVITSTPPSPAVANLPYVYEVKAQDADGDTIRFRLRDPLAGVSLDEKTGKLTWTPTSDQVGTHPLTIVARTAGPVKRHRASIWPVVATAPNDPPVITSTPRLRARVGQQYVYAVQASDPNGDPLVFQLTTAPQGMTVDSADGIRWQVPSGNLGQTVAVAVQVDDGRGGVATQSFTLEIVSQDTNTAPRVVSTPPLSAVVGRTYVYNVTAEDPEGDPVVFALEKGPAGMSIDPLRGTLRWTPAADQTGPQDVILRVQDVFLAAGTQSFTVNVRAVNLPPAITSSPPVQANPGELYVYAVRASDPDGDRLSFRLSAAPTGMTIDPATGVVQWTPATALPDPQTVRIVVEDGQGGIDSQGLPVDSRPAGPEPCTGHHVDAGLRRNHRPPVPLRRDGQRSRGPDCRLLARTPAGRHGDRLGHRRHHLDARRIAGWRPHGDGSRQRPGRRGRRRALS